MRVAASRAAGSRQVAACLNPRHLDARVERGTPALVHDRLHQEHDRGVRHVQRGESPTASPGPRSTISRRAATWAAYASWPRVVSWTHVRTRPWPVGLRSSTYPQSCRTLRCLLSTELSLIHISEPTRQAEISYAVFC